MTNYRGLWHLAHLREQVGAYVRDLQRMPPEEFAEILLEQSPEEQAIILCAMERTMQESNRIISEIEGIWEAQGFDVEEKRRQVYERIQERENKRKR